MRSTSSATSRPATTTRRAAPRSSRSARSTTAIPLRAGTSSPARRPSSTARRAACATLACPRRRCAPQSAEFHPGSHPMSDALNFLVKARPEAMGHYFAFLKDAGKHLDPKTRNLISVITKVHSQTEHGLKQYLKRALREGATPVEVIDALLMAF